MLASAAAALLQNTTVEAVCAGAAGDGCAIRCSYKADDGFLYPLDKAFLYVHKPLVVCVSHVLQVTVAPSAAATSVHKPDAAGPAS
jgi:hypothetical protein